MIRQLGISDIQHYYMSGGENTAFDSWSRIELCEPLDRDALSWAVGQALHNFPELAYRPVLHEATVWAAPNEAKVPLLEDDGSQRYYGTDETAGYMFAVLCRADGFSLSQFHGLSDFGGIWRFTRTILYYYAIKRGLRVEPEEGIRTSADAAWAMDELERYDPYRKFCTGAATTPAEQKDPFNIPEPLFAHTEDCCVEHTITCPLDQFLQASKRLNTSVAPLLTWAVSNALTKVYDTGGLPILTMLPTNIRSTFGTQTLSNFDYPLTMAYDADIQRLPTDQQASALRQQIKSQMTMEHYLPHLSSKVQRFEGILKSGTAITEWNRRFGQPLPPGVKMPFTLPLTYPGSMTLSEGYAPLVRCITRHAYVRLGLSFGMLASTYGNTIYINSCQRFESDAIMQQLRDTLQQAGIPATLTSSGRFKGNKANCEKFLTV